MVKSLLMKKTIFLSVFIFCSVVFSAQETITYNVFNGAATLTFDSLAISRDMLAQCIQTYPQASGIFDVMPVAIYNEKESEVRFLEKAEKELQKARTAQQSIDSLKVADELKIYVDIATDRLGWFSWLLHQEYLFIKNDDMRFLKEPYQSLDPEKVCPEILKKIENSKNKNAKNEMATYNWHNAMNDAFWDHMEKKYGKEIINNSVVSLLPWEEFVKKYQIKEEFVYEEP